MGDYSWAVDALVIALVVVSAYLAMVRGFFRELFALASWVIAFFAALFLGPQLYPHLAQIPGLDVLGRNCYIGQIVAFLVVFGAALIVAGIVIWLFSSGAQHYSAVSVVDQLLGLIYGAVRGLVLVAALLIGYEIVASDERYEVINSAATYEYIKGTADFMRANQPEGLKEWVTGHVERVRQKCEVVEDGGSGA